MSRKSKATKLSAAVARWTNKTAQSGFSAWRAWAGRHAANRATLQTAIGLDAVAILLLILGRT